jgi:hypothetical protein
MPIRITDTMTYDFGAVYGRATGPVGLNPISGQANLRIPNALYPNNVATSLARADALQA